MKEQSDKVSIVMTCYNYARYLSNAINSALSQTYSNKEVILVNDGSSDDTDNVAKQYVTLPNFKYIKQDNSGQANAKNKGIANSSGNYLAFLDADDFWDKGKLEKQMALFNRAAVGVVFSQSRYIDEHGRQLDDFRLTSKYLVPRSGRVTDHLIFDNFVPFSSAVVRRECLERFGLFDESLTMGIDWDLWLRISTAYEFAFVGEPLISYRVGHSGQMSKKLEERQRCSDRIMLNFLNNNPGLVPPRIIKMAYAYTFCNRGYFFRKIDWTKSNHYYVNAIKKYPAEIEAYKGLMKNMLYLLLYLFPLIHGKFHRSLPHSHHD